MNDDKTPPSGDTASRPKRHRAFQRWELEIAMEIAKKAGKAFKYPLYRLGDNGRWMFSVCSDNSEIPFTKTQMNLYREAEEWVEKGGDCPFSLKDRTVAATGLGQSGEDENLEEDQGVKL